MVRFIFPLAIFLLVGVGGYFVLSGESEDMLVLEETMNREESSDESAQMMEEAQYVAFSTTEVVGSANELRFSAEIPAGWQIEAVATIGALNIYDPDSAGTTNLEQSQIFIRHFSANRFLTLQTVTIHQQDELQIQDRDAVRYVIEKKSGVANFASQPLWRNELHTVTDIRVTESSPSIFYVVAGNPALDKELYERFLNSIQPDSTQ